MVGELDAAIVPARAELGIVADPIELQQPVLEPGRNRELAGADGACARVPGDHRLGPGAPGRGADADNLGQGNLGGPVRGEGAMNGPAGGFDQGSHFERLLAVLPGAQGRPERQGAHAATAHVGQAIEDGDGFLRDAFGLHPGIDQGVAEGIRQGVREKAW